MGSSSARSKTDHVLGEVGKVLGFKWKALTPEDKKPYEDRAAEEKKKYEKAKAQYEAENPKDKKKAATKKSKKAATSDVCQSSLRVCTAAFSLSLHCDPADSALGR